MSRWHVKVGREFAEHTQWLMHIAFHSALNTNSDVWDSDCIVYVQEIRNQVLWDSILYYQKSSSRKQKDSFHKFSVHFSFFNLFCICETLNHVIASHQWQNWFPLTRTNHKPWALPKPSYDLNFWYLFPIQFFRLRII